MNALLIAWLNFGLLLLSAALFLYFYVKSVSPAALAQQMGPQAYARCGRCRAVAILFECIAAATYVVYFFYPLPLPLPRTFGWGWPVSIVLALLIGAPSLWLMVRGMLDAGMESVAPRPEQTLFGGIYAHMRHPQAVGEVVLWWVLALALNSPHLVLISLIWLPIFYWMCVAEERDLALRYGQAYRDYQARTGFLLPKGPFTKSF